MAFREKTAWISLVTILAIYGLYFSSVVRGTAAPFGGLLGTVVAIVIVEVVLTVLATMVSPRDARAPRDEREKLISLKSAQFAYAALAVSVALACFFGGFNPPIVFNANALLFVLVMAEILRWTCQIVQYRRGA